MMKKRGSVWPHMYSHNLCPVNASPIVDYETWLPLLEIQFISAEKNWVSPWTGFLPHLKSGPSTSLVTL